MAWSFSGMFCTTATCGGVVLSEPYHSLEAHGLHSESALRVLLAGAGPVRWSFSGMFCTTATCGSAERS